MSEKIGLLRMVLRTQPRSGAEPPTQPERGVHAASPYERRRAFTPAGTSNSEAA